MSNGKHIENGENANREYTQKRKGRGCLAVFLIVLGLLLVIVCLLTYIGYKILNEPQALFKDNTIFTEPEEEAEEPELQIIEPIIEVEPEEEDDFGDEELDIPGLGGELDEETIETDEDTVNILLVGLDAYTDGRTTSGTQPHADVCMVLSVNFAKKSVSLITLPRDLLTTTPGYSGFYKLNGTFNVGGGMDDIPSGLNQVRKTAEEWLGGISIPYYYAVNFQAVIDLVNAVGGIDYDVDQTFTDWYGTTYYEGMRHLDGDAVLGYLRIRKYADGTDRSRTARQRRMLVAMFKKLKNESKLTQIPDLISSVSGNMWTNTTLAQTAALVNFAMKISDDDIGTYCVDGANIIMYEWAFTYVHQEDRIELIKEVFGINAEPVGVCSKVYEKFLHQYGFTGLKYISQAEKTLEFVRKNVTDASKMSIAERAAYTECYRDYRNLLYAYENVSDWYEENWENGGSAPGLDTLKNRESELKESCTELAKIYEYDQELSWKPDTEWYYDSDINEVRVDFR